MFGLEWPLSFVSGTSLHRSLEFRLAILPLTALSAALIYQGTNAALYYLIGMIVYFWGYSEGEVSYLSPLIKREAILTCLLDHLRNALDSTPTWTCWWWQPCIVGYAGPCLPNSSFLLVSSVEDQTSAGEVFSQPSRKERK